MTPGACYRRAVTTTINARALVDDFVADWFAKRKRKAVSSRA
jgi:hypothetical protein